jgi:hypothetical protein
MKSTTNRYRPPRVQYKLDNWNKNKVVSSNTPAFGKKKKKNSGK